jgi:hypothetical protein
VKNWIRNFTGCSADDDYDDDDDDDDGGGGGGDGDDDDDDYADDDDLLLGFPSCCVSKFPYYKFARTFTMLEHLIP